MLITAEIVDIKIFHTMETSKLCRVGPFYQRIIRKNKNRKNNKTRLTMATMDTCSMCTYSYKI